MIRHRQRPRYDRGIGRAKIPGPPQDLLSDEIVVRTIKLFILTDGVACEAPVLRSGESAQGEAPAFDRSLLEYVRFHP